MEFEFEGGFEFGFEFEFNGTERRRKGSDSNSERITKSWNSICECFFCRGGVRVRIRVRVGFVMGLKVPGLGPLKQQKGND